MDPFTIIIAGSRTFTDYHTVNLRTAEFLRMLKEKGVRKEGQSVEVMSGCAKGADLLGEQFAGQYKLHLVRMPANWEKDGRSAGYRRNERMAECGNACIVFWDGKSPGSNHMVEQAKRHDIPTAVWNASDNTLQFFNV